jgi:NDP-sugar pyrophosphorylase family protein
LNKSLSVSPGDERVTTALLLAAGTGSRLSPLTDSIPKCLVQLNGISILERLIDSLKSYGFKRLVVVVGYHEECIRDFLSTRAGAIEITYVQNPLYNTTGNIYSLWLAMNKIDEPFLMLESDIVFEMPLLKEMLRPDRIAVAKLQPWMNGTTVTIDQNQEIDAFWASGSDCDSFDIMRYKTVNMYSFSTISWKLIKERLEQHISNNKVKGFYETVLSELVAEGSLHFTSVFFETNRWYEIDTLDDLHEAEQIFPKYALVPMTPARQVRSQSKVNSKVKPHGLMS